MAAIRKKMAFPGDRFPEPMAIISQGGGKLADLILREIKMKA
jgi:hypothetical protein